MADTIKKAGKYLPIFGFFFNNKSESYKYGRTSTQEANQTMIANLAYDDAHRSKGYKIGNNQLGDGWRFRGRGILQITGRENYTKQQATINSLLKNGTVNIIIEDNAKDHGFTMQQAVVSGLADWYNKENKSGTHIYDIALYGDGDDIVNKITEVINKSTDSYDARVAHFHKTKQTFQTNECKNL